MVGKSKHRFKLRNWQLFLILVPLLFLSATFLRIDHLRMAELRDSVLDADAFGDEGEIENSLSVLATFTQKHIVINITEENGSPKITFGTGPFYLEQSYLRDAAAALKAAEEKLVNGDNPNGNIFALADEACKSVAIANGWTWDSAEYINCMTSEINKYPAAEEITDVILADIPSTELYRKEFSSPVWTFSLSGITILLSLILIVVIFTRFIIWCAIRLSLLFL